MALVEQALGKWVAASEHIRQALAMPRHSWITKNRAALNEAAARVAEHVGQIEILGATPGADIRLDGVARGSLPLAQPLAATTGTVTIDILMRGRLPARRTTSVRAGEVTRESFDALATSTTAVAASLVEDSEKKGSGTRAAVPARAPEARASPRRLQPQRVWPAQQTYSSPRLPGMMPTTSRLALTRRPLVCPSCS